MIFGALLFLVVRAPLDISLLKALARDGMREKGNNAG
jgi:hypothetical protein